MGKSPGRWIKNLLLGKKSSNSKGRDVLRSSNKGEQLMSSAKIPVPNVAADSMVISQPLIKTVAPSGNQVPVDLPADQIVCSDPKEVSIRSIQVAVSSPVVEDPVGVKLEQAAIKVQSAFRGYLARREFRSLKCVVALQAQVRGHLVRRQAVSTLRCVKGIVKFQELVRRHKGASNSIDGNASTKVKRQFKNAFVYKLRASSPGAIPLRLQYSHDEPNAASLWLQRWTGSLFYVPKNHTNLKPRKKNQNARTAQAETDGSKRSARRLSGSNVENGSISKTLDSDKGKRNVKKTTLQEQSPNEIEKVKRNSKNNHDPVKEISDQSPVANRKPKHKTKKLPGSPAITDMEPEVPNTPVEKLQTESQDSPAVAMIGNPEDIQELNHELGCRDDSTLGSYQKPNERRASLPAKFDPQENGVLNTPKLPSYMAPTESVRAKLRAQGSPRYARDAAEKNALLRRHSLSSSTNSLLITSASPRAHKLVQANGRVLRGDRSFSSSRDGDKLIQAEWKR